MVDVNKFESIKIGLASPDRVRSWSYGEVKKPETINYRTLKPEKDGLFCERIFGPTKDYECTCGKYKRVRYAGVVCDRCGVEVTKAIVRRERMGHIELASPVTHIWYFKGIPSRMGLILDMSPRSLEEVIYFASYVVTDAGDTALEEKQLLTEREYRDYKKEYGNRFQASIGAEAIKELLMKVDLETECAELKEELRTAKGQKRTRAIRRLDIMDAFRKSGNRPEWMVLDVIPVIPPELRPMVQLDGGRFATSDLNDLYRRVINRNNRLKRLLDLNAPVIIVQNEKRMLQEAVDALIDNGRRGRPVAGPGNRPLKSLSHMLKGKQGRFRQNLLGKRVDYSGRSVIAIGPHLNFYQCGLPKEMALELFKPFLTRELVSREIATNAKHAKRLIDRNDDQVWEPLADIMREHPVLLNRAPTLHRLGIQAFEPVLVEGKAMRLHPLACEAYNADFDGDQMAIHLPLGEEAQAEARILMLAASHILNPKDGQPVVTPSQDMVLGNYYLTQEENGANGEGMVISSPSEAHIAYENGAVQLHTRIVISPHHFTKFKWTEKQKDQLLVTSIGKLFFNEIMPDNFPFINEPTKENLHKQTDDRFFVDPGKDYRTFMDQLELTKPFKKGYLEDIIAAIFEKLKVTETSQFLDRLKSLGYYFSTKSGITVGISDITVLDTKDSWVEKGHKQVENITKQYRRGLITDDERYDEVIKTWNAVKDKIEGELTHSLSADNPFFIMMDSGARGNISNFTQLAGMRGLMAGPSGKIIELPVTSNFREGLSVQEMFISTHGARKGMTDTALKTADSGYLTRRLVDVAQDVIIRETDCGTDRGLEISAIKEGKEMIEDLAERLTGRYIQKTVYDPKTGEVLAHHNQLITPEKAQQIQAAGVTSVTIRSAFTCRTRHGVCKCCYGSDLATNGEVEVGEAVGIVAAQSIGEPGTQLTMRTFHTGGVAGDDITQGLPRVQEIVEARHPKGQAVITEVTGEVVSVHSEEETRTKTVTVKGQTDEREYKVPFTSRMKVAEGDFVYRGQQLTEGSIDPKELLRITNSLTVLTYMLAEIQRVYRQQGVDINDKHVEVLLRQMMRKVRVLDPGASDLLPGNLMDIGDFEDANAETIRTGQQPATCQPVLLGITKAALETKSFLSAASFQETTKVLTDAAISGKKDQLLGLKENVIIGKIIPAGTGVPRYRKMEPDKLTPSKVTEIPMDMDLDFESDLGSGHHLQTVSAPIQSDYHGMP